MPLRLGIWVYAYTTCISSLYVYRLGCTPTPHAFHAYEAMDQGVRLYHMHFMPMTLGSGCTPTPHVFHALGARIEVYANTTRIALYCISYYYVLRLVIVVVSCLRGLWGSVLLELL